jgi:phage tail sheath protein FI
MPVSPTYPGVYIEEVPSGARTIVGVSTSIAAFIGSFTRGPIDHAVQLFKGDFEREYGGLRADSEASYAIQQFFLNGGSEAWVVRTASGGYQAASVTMQDEAGSDVLRATAGRRASGALVRDPGAWGNNMRIDVDYDTRSPATEFNLTVTEIRDEGGRTVVLRTENYRNLTMTAGASNNALAVVNDGSRLIQLNRDTGWPPNRPVATGSLGGPVPNPIPAGTFNPGDQFQLALGTISVSVAPDFTTPPTTPAELRHILQSAIRAADLSQPLLVNAAVSLVGRRLRLLTGRTVTNYDPEDIFAFADNVGTPAAAAGFLAGDARHNVQQYVLGSPNTPIAFMSAATSGSDGNLPDAAALRGNRNNRTGMYALEDVDIFNILCVPSAPALDAPGQITNYAQVMNEAVTYCEERRAFLLLDIPGGVNTVDEARDWLDDVAATGLRHRNAAAYFPRPQMPDPLNDNRLRDVAASGTMAGIYARTDGARGIWKAPAGIEATLRNAPALGYLLTDPENGQLNPVGLNCLRNFDVFGNVGWGARTMVGADALASEWKYVPVRRLALFLEESLYRGTQWVVFEPNDEPLWAQIRLNVGAFMQNLFRQGAFQGSTPRDAYLVKCDNETTTQNDINLGIVNIVVGFSPLKPAEFVIIKIQQLAGQIQT